MSSYEVAGKIACTIKNETWECDIPQKDGSTVTEKVDQLYADVPEEIVVPSPSEGNTMKTYVENGKAWVNGDSDKWMLIVDRDNV